MSGAPVSWRSKKQSCIALSTAEAECMSLTSAAQEAIWPIRDEVKKGKINVRYCKTEDMIAEC